jgi:hypothetical protein
MTRGCKTDSSNPMPDRNGFLSRHGVLGTAHLPSFLLLNNYNLRNDVRRASVKDAVYRRFDGG